MTNSKTPPPNQPTVVVMGRIPPPVTGMTLVTQEVLARLRDEGPVEFVNWSVGTTNRTLLTRLRYVGRFFGSALRLWFRDPSNGQRLYLVANSKAGLHTTALIVYVAVRRGYKVYLHHHVYSYIDEYDRRMARIDRLMGAQGVHVVHSAKMAADFRERYQSSCAFAIVLPSVVSIAVASPRQLSYRPVRIGMLSNLTMAKGIGRAAETFAKLREAGRNVELLLAGPIHEPAARQVLEQTQGQYPELVHYRGPLYGEDKARFFAELDVFVFPTKYANESWGIVLNEALAAGVPVITMDRGCTRAVVGERAGIVVNNSEDFVNAAAAQIERWLDHPEEYGEASRAAIEQADYLNAEGQRTLDEFATHMFSPLDSSTGLLSPIGCHKP